MNRIHANRKPDAAAIIAVGGAVTINAQSGEAAHPRSFSAVAYTGAELVVAGYSLPVVVDLSGMTTAKTIIANLDHVATQRVGQVANVHNDGNTLRLDGTLSAATPARDEVIASADQGFAWQMSVEVRPVGKLEVVPEGKIAAANGRTFKGPVLIARKSRMYGVAFVGQGADEQTSATIAASAATQAEVREMKFEEWIVAQGFDAATLSDKQRAVLQGAYNAEIKAAGGAPNATIKASPVFDIDELKAAYASCEAEIETAVSGVDENIDRAKVLAAKAKAIKAALTLKQEAIQGEWSPLQFEVKATRVVSEMQQELIRAERPKGPAVHASRRDMTPQVIEAALSQTLRLPGIEEHYKPEVLEAAQAAFRGRLGLQQVLITAAAQNGMDLGPGERINDGNLRSVLRHAFGDVRASFSTVTLPGIFSNVANKELLSGYMETDQSWREIARVANVSDFKTHTSYRLLDSLDYEPLGPGGEIKHGTLSEESYTRKAKTYAKMLALTREDIINDDLGAFDDLRNRLGRGAAQKFNDIFWAAFVDNSSFFTSGRGNYITGSTTTLLTDGVGLGLGVKAFRQLASGTGDGSKRIGGNPSVLLVPPELEAAAETIYVNTNVGAVKGSDANIYAKKYRPVVCPWLSDSSVTGYSTTAWYLLRDPAVMAPMVVSFLNGQQSPTVESAEADFNTLGIQFRGYHDFGCDKSEYMAGIKSKGAA